MKPMEHIGEKHLKLLARKMQPLEKLLLSLNAAHEKQEDWGPLHHMTEAHKEMVRQFDLIAEKMQMSTYRARTSKQKE